MPIQVWLSKRNSATRTDSEEQRMMFDQVRFVPALPEAVACPAVTSLIKPDCPVHIGQMMKSPFKAEFKGAHFKNYDKMYSTGTWSFPVLEQCCFLYALRTPSSLPRQSLFGKSKFALV
jgi:hypothetical protein